MPTTQRIYRQVIALSDTASPLLPRPQILDHNPWLPARHWQTLNPPHICGRCRPLVVLWRFRSKSEPESVRAEKTASRIAGVLLFVVAGSVLIIAARAILGYEEPRPSLLGIILLSAAAFGMPWLEIEAQSTIKDPAIERSPGVYSPSAIWALACAKKRVPACLANIREVLRIHEHSKVPEAVFGDQANQDVRERT